MSDDTIQEGQLDLSTMTASDMLCVVQDMFDNAPAGSEPYMDLDFEDQHGFIRTITMCPANDNEQAYH